MPVFPNDDEEEVQTEPMPQPIQRRSIDDELDDLTPPPAPVAAPPQPRTGTTGGIVPTFESDTRPVRPAQWSRDPLARDEQVRTALGEARRRVQEQQNPFTFSPNLPDRPVSDRSTYRAQSEANREVAGDVMRERTAVIGQRRENLLQQKTRNAQIEEQARSTGQLLYKDEFGNWQPKVDAATGKPMFSRGSWEAGVDPAGRPQLRRRNQYGEPEYKAPPLSLPTSPVADDNIYARFADGTTAKYMTAEEARNSADIKLRHLGFRHAKQKNDALRNKTRGEALELARAVGIEVKTRQAEAEDLELKQQEIGKQLANVTDPIMRKQLDDQGTQLAMQVNTLKQALKPGGELHHKNMMAQLQMKVAIAETARNSHVDSEQEIAARVTEAGGSAESDPTFVANRHEMGLAEEALQEARTALAKYQANFAGLTTIAVPQTPVSDVKQPGLLSKAGGIIANTAKLAARGATAEGFFAAAEGAGRMYASLPINKAIEAGQDWLTEKIQGFPLTEEQKATRARDRAAAARRFGGAAVDAAALGYAEQANILREQIRQALPVDQAFAETLWGQVAQGGGQMVGTLPMAAAGSPALALTSLGQIYQEAFDDAKAPTEQNPNGADDATAHRAAMKYLPAAALDFLSNKLIIGKILKPLIGKAKVSRVRDLLTTAATEGGTEAAQQAYLNAIAQKLEGYDENRTLDKDVLNSLVVGAVVGGGVTAAGQAGAAAVKRFAPKDGTPPAPPAAPEEGTPPPSTPPPAAPVAPGTPPPVNDTGITGTDVAPPTPPPITNETLDAQQRADDEAAAAAEAGVDELEQGFAPAAAPAEAQVAPAAPVAAEPAPEPFAPSEEPPAAPAEEPAETPPAASAPTTPESALAEQTPLSAALTPGPNTVAIEEPTSESTPEDRAVEAGIAYNNWQRAVAAGDEAAALKWRTDYVRLRQAGAAEVKATVAQEVAQEPAQEAEVAQEEAAPELTTAEKSPEVAAVNPPTMEIATEGSLPAIPSTDEIAARFAEVERRREEMLHAEPTPVTPPPPPAAEVSAAPEAAPSQQGAGVVQETEQERANREQGERFDRELKEQRAKEDAEMAALPAQEQSPDRWVEREVKRLAVEKGLSVAESREQHRGTLRAMMGNALKHQIGKRGRIHADALSKITHDWKLKLPRGYVREGDYFVYRKPQPQPTPTPAERMEDARRRGRAKADAGIVPREEWAEFRKARAEMEPTPTPPAAEGVKPSSRAPESMSDAEIAAEIKAMDDAAAPHYDALEAMGDDAFTPKGAKYTPEAQKLNDAIKPYAERKRFLTIERDRRVMDARNKLYQKKRDKEIADAPVWQRRNGWEIVRRGHEYVMRDPYTKEDIYSSGKLTRVREVADESKPEPPTASSNENTTPATVAPIQAGNESPSERQVGRPTPEAEVVTRQSLEKSANALSDEDAIKELARLMDVSPESPEYSEMEQQVMQDRVNSIVHAEETASGTRYQYRLVKDGEFWAAQMRIARTDGSFSPWDGPIGVGKGRDRAAVAKRFAEFHPDAARTSTDADIKAASDSIEAREAERVRQAEVAKAEEAKKQTIHSQYLEEVRQTPLKGKSAEITIRSRDGKVEYKVQAMTYGNWAIRKEAKGRDSVYVISHIPSGLKAVDKPTLGQAKEVVQGFIHSGVDPSSPDLAKDNAALKKLASVVKALNGGETPEWFTAQPPATPTMDIETAEAPPLIQVAPPEPAGAERWWPDLYIRDRSGKNFQQVTPEQASALMEKVRGEIRLYDDSGTDIGRVGRDGRVMLEDIDGDKEIPIGKRSAEAMDVEAEPEVGEKPAGKAQRATEPASDLLRLRVEEIRAALKQAYPFKGIRTGSEERVFVAKAKKALAPLGVPADVVDSAIDATRSYGQTVVYASDESIMRGLRQRGWLTEGNLKLPSKSSTLLSALAAEKARVIKKRQGRVGGGPEEIFDAAYIAALDVATVAVKAGKVVADAIKMAVQRFRAMHPKHTSEDLARAESQIRSALEGPPPSSPATPTPPSTPPSGQTFTGPVQSGAPEFRKRSKSSLGEYEYAASSTDEAKRKYATEFADWHEKNGSYEAAVSEMRSIDQASFRGPVAAELLARQMEAETEATNDGDRLIIGRRIDSLWGDVMSEKTEAGQALQANVVMNERLTPFRSVLAWKGHLRQRIEEATKDIPADTVGRIKKGVKDAGDEAAGALKEIVEAPPGETPKGKKNQNAIDAWLDKHASTLRLLRQEAKARGLNWADIFNALPESQEARKAELLDRVKQHPKLQGLSPSSQKRLAENLDEAWTYLRNQIFRREFSRLVELPKVAKPDVEKIKSVVGDLIKFSNLGLLDNTAFLNAIAEKYGMESMDGPTAKKLQDYAVRIQNAKTPAEKARLELEMAHAFHVASGVTVADWLTSVNYANILSAYTTQVGGNLVPNLMNSMWQMATMAAVNPRRATGMAKGYASGIPEGLRQALSILATSHGGQDAAAILAESKGDALELMATGEAFPRLKEKLPKLHRLAQGHAATMRYVSRFMRAVDAMSYYPAREAFTWVAADKLLAADYKGEERARKVREMLGIGPENFDAFKKQAEAEGFTGHDLSRRISDLIEQKRASSGVSKEATEQGKRFAQSTTLFGEPEGWAGVIYRMASRAVNTITPGGVPVLKPFMLFLRVPTNFYNVAMNATPLGGVRATIGRTVVDKQPGQKPTYRKLSQDERNQLYLQSVIGTTIMGYFAARALAATPDDDDMFDITASGPREAGARAQWLAAGNIPYSIRIPGTRTRVSYQNSPLAAPLALAGHVADSARYDDVPDQRVQNALTNALIRFPSVILGAPVLQGLTELAALTDPFRPNISKTENFFKNLGKNLVIPRILTQLHQQFIDDTVEDRGVPRYDSLGENVRRKPGDRFIKSETEDPLRRFLDRNDLRVPVAARDAKINGEKMTEKQYAEYARRSGIMVRIMLKGALPTLRGMTQEQAQKEISAITTKQRDGVLEQIRAENPGFTKFRPPTMVR